MAWAIYQYRDAQGRLPIQEWHDTLGSEERAKFDAKIDVLEQNGPDQFQGGWCASLGGGILKLKIKGRRQLRPMLCKGPLDVKGELTLLREAIEKGDELLPPDAEEQARVRMDEVAKDPERRRRSWPTKLKT